MADKRLPPRQVLSKNLKALQEKTGLSGPEIARRAGVDRKTVNNQINGRYDPQPDLVDKVAKVFGVTGWMLLSSSFDVNAAASDQTQRLVELYNASNEDGRESILRVAEMAAKSK